MPESLNIPITHICHASASNSKKAALSSCQSNKLQWHWSVVSYCDSLFHNMTEKDIARLQHVENCPAIVVTNAPRFSRPIHILKKYIGFLSSFP